MSARATARDVDQRGDWRQVRDLYRQFSTIVDSSQAPSPEITSALAEALARVFAAYEDSESAFVDDLTALFGSIDGMSVDPIDRYRYLYQDTRLDRFSLYGANANGRTRPKPFEAAIETVRRIEDLNRVRDALTSIPSSAVLGGSMSYGRFFNVRGGSHGWPSDTDIILVLPDYAFLPQLASALRGLEFISSESLDLLADRAEMFPAIRANHERCSFQHKLRLWEGQLPPSFAGYQVPCHYYFALHVLSLEDFAFVTLRDLPVLRPNFRRWLHEYRDDRPSADADKFSCFAGYVRSITQDHSETPDGGFILKGLVAEIEGGRLYPGVLMNLILPQFEVRWEAPETRIRLALLNFRWKLLARLMDERQMRRFEIQRLSQAHVRNAAFAPHVARRVDRA